MNIDCQLIIFSSIWLVVALTFDIVTSSETFCICSFMTHFVDEVSVEQTTHEMSYVKAEAAVEQNGWSEHGGDRIRI